MHAPQTAKLGVVEAGGGELSILSAPDQPQSRPIAN